MGATENRKLLAEKEVLGNEARPRPERGEQRAKCGLKDCEHPREGRAGRSPCHPRIAAAPAVCWPSAHAGRLPLGMPRKTSSSPPQPSRIFVNPTSRESTSTPSPR